jgi:hypothetical protein
MKMHGATHIKTLDTIIEAVWESTVCPKARCTHTSEVCVPCPILRIPSQTVISAPLRHRTSETQLCAPDLIGLLLDPEPPSRGKRIRINAFLSACGDFYLFASLKEFVRGDEFEFNWQFSLRHMSLPS